MHRRLILTFVALVGLCLPSLANAQKGAKEKLAAAKKKLVELQRAAKKLAAAGKEAEAKVKLNAARGLEKELKQHLARLKAAGGKKNRQKSAKAAGEKALIADLNRGLAALRKLGLKKQAAEIAELAERALYARRTKSGKKIGEKKANRGKSEREVAKRYIEVFQMALPVYREINNKNAINQLEHIIKARTLALSGKRNEEIAGYIKEMPELGQQVELLAYASKLWAKFGNKDKAHATGELADTLAAALKRRQAGKGEGERREQRPKRKVRKRKRDEDVAAPRKIGRDERARKAGGRVKELEQRIRRLEEAIERLIKSRREKR